MIPFTLRVILTAVIIIYFIIVLLLLKNKALELKYTLLWIVAGVVMGLMVIFPGILSNLVRLVGIADNMNGLYVLAIGFIFMILMALTSIISRQAMKIRKLIQEMAFQEKRIRELEDEVKQ